MKTEDRINFKRYNAILTALIIILAVDYSVLKLIALPVNYSFLIGLIALIYTIVYLGIAVEKKEKIWDRNKHNRYNSVNLDYF